VLDFSFEVTGLAQLIADVDIHAKPQNTGSGSREALSSLQFGFYTRTGKVKGRKVRKVFSIAFVSRDGKEPMITRPAASF
jgi:hypothetical protein